MKRSEALKLLERAFRANYDYHIQKSDHLIHALNKSLEVLEKAGMLPPSHSKMTSTAVWIDDSPDGGHYESVPFELTVHEWEKE